jgi:hypothetical protein
MELLEELFHMYPTYSEVISGGMVKHGVPNPTIRCRGVWWCEKRQVNKYTT